jgi:hypothetical protein
MYYSRYEVKDGGLYIYADKAGADGNKLGGKYTCTATNSYTIQSSSATLKVPVAPVRKFICQTFY